MKRRHSSKQGFAAAELGLMLPMLVVLMFLLFEGSNAMRTYSAMVEASREGARVVLRDGGVADMQGLMTALLNDVPAESISSKVTTNEAAKTVTVEVICNYQPFNGGSDALEMLSGSSGFTLRAKTTMPLP